MAARLPDRRWYSRWSDARNLSNLEDDFGNGILLPDLDAHRESFQVKSFQRGLVVGSQFSWFFVRGGRFFSFYPVVTRFLSVNIRLRL